jgi:GMP synthase (glutamine-hydrolysing)
MKDTFECGVSSFGSCWALQIAAVALGGAVELNPKGREVGIGRKVSMTPEGRSHPMFTGKKSVFECFMSHGDEVTRVPHGALITAGNDHSSIQAMAVTHKGTESWYVQYHPEYDFDYYASLIGMRKERMVRFILLCLYSCILSHFSINAKCSLGYFKTPEDIDTYVAELKELHNDNTRKVPLDTALLDTALLDTALLSYPPPSILHFFLAIA